MDEYFRRQCVQLGLALPEPPIRSPEDYVQDSSQRVRQTIADARAKRLVDERLAESTEAILKLLITASQAAQTAQGRPGHQHATHKFTVSDAIFMWVKYLVERKMFGTAVSFLARVIDATGYCLGGTVAAYVIRGAGSAGDAEATRTSAQHMLDVMAACDLELTDEIRNVTDAFDPPLDPRGMGTRRVGPRDEGKNAKQQLNRLLDSCKKQGRLANPMLVTHCMARALEILDDLHAPDVVVFTAAMRLAELAEDDVHVRAVMDRATRADRCLPGHCPCRRVPRGQQRPRRGHRGSDGQHPRWGRGRSSGLPLPSTQNHPAPASRDPRCVSVGGGGTVAPSFGGPG
jgi:hypothetical protein